MDKKEFGKYIVKVRKEKQMTQKDIAEALHVSIPSVSKWERGINYPDITLLESLCKILDISITQLFMEDGTEHIVKESDAIFKTYSQWL